MVDSSLVAIARKIRYNDLPSFSGQTTENVDRFLRSLKDIIGATNESEDNELFEIIRGKLTQTAGSWFDRNKTKFRTWLDFEKAFREEYLSNIIVNMKFGQLTHRRKRPDERLMDYCYDVIDSWQEITPTISDQMIIQYLLSGLDSKIQIEIRLQESAMSSLDEFLKCAKTEQDIIETLGQKSNTFKHHR